MTRDEHTSENTVIARFGDGWEETHRCDIPIVEFDDSDYDPKNPPPVPPPSRERLAARERSRQQFLQWVREREERSAREGGTPPPAE